jgi:hypothetical protein
MGYMATMEKGILELAEEVAAMTKSCREGRRRRRRPRGGGGIGGPTIRLPWILPYLDPNHKGRPIGSVFG